MKRFAAKLLALLSSVMGSAACPGPAALPADSAISGNAQQANGAIIGNALPSSPPVSSLPVATPVAPPVAPAVSTPPVAAPPIAVPHISRPPSPRVSIVVRPALPGSLVIDGDIAEWGTLATVDDAPSRLETFFNPEAMVVVGELTELAKDGIWLGVKSAVSEQRQIATMMRWSEAEATACSYVEQPREGAARRAEVADCQRVRADFAAAKRADAAAGRDGRFMRIYRVDASGVRLAQGKKLLPIAGSAFGFRQTPGGATFELSIPPAAWPRVADAPLTHVLALATAASEPRPKDQPEPEWAPLLFPDVTFEPLGEIREAAMTLGMDVEFNGGYAVSYQPGEAHLIEFTDKVLRGGRKRLETRSVPLYEKVASLGDVEVGTTLGGARILTLKGGELSVLSCDIAGAKLRDVRARQDKLYVVAYQEGTLADRGYVEEAGWRAFIIDAEGLCEVGQSRPPDYAWKRGVKPFHSPDFDSFGLAGRVRDDASFDGATRRLELTWRLDADGQYVFTESAPEPVPEPRSARPDRYGSSGP